MKNLKYIILYFYVIAGLFSCVNNNNVISETAESIVSRITPPVFQNKDFVVTDFGVFADDSLANNCLAFRRIIQECHKEGGGRVLVPAGKYWMNGPIHLMSKVNLHLMEGAVLLFSSNPDNYLPVVKTSWEGTMLYNYSPFIYGSGLTDIAITGKGVIDGEASTTWNNWKAKQTADQMLSREMNHKNVPVEERVFGDGHYLRPHLIQLHNCKNILIEDIRIEDAPFWCLHLLMCKNATVRGLSYDAMNKNNDGIDPENSEDILIENIDFNNADDNVAIKAGRDHEGRAMGLGSKNIVIRNCNLKGLHGIVIGSEMSGGVKNVFVENCCTTGYLKRGVYIKSNPDRGGQISNIHFDNMQFGQVEDCFFITSYYHSEGEGFETDIYNIFANNIYCQKASGSGIAIQGYATKKVHDIHFSNVVIDTANIAISLKETMHIVMDDVVIGGEAEAPSYVQ